MTPAAPDRRLILCADDYGLSPGINGAILELIAADRLAAASCMVVFPEWLADAAALRQFRDRVDLGLHLTLTGAAPLGLMPRLAPDGLLPHPLKFVSLALLGQLAYDEVRAEIERQLDAFECGIGRTPDHVDGHYYVHLYPVVREALIDVYHSRLVGSGVYIRWCGDRPGSILRRRVGFPIALGLHVLSGRLRAMTHREGIPINAGFTGVYDLSERTPYERLFHRFLLAAQDRTVLVCHPGRVDGVLRSRDFFQGPREQELAYFRSEACARALVARGIRLSRFS